MSKTAAGEKSAAPNAPQVQKRGAATETTHSVRNEPQAQKLPPTECEQ
jgi:hypothetical protein